MNRLCYLSGAPRVSTRSEAETTGARAHVLGVIDGFKKCNWQVTPYIVGDMVPLSWIVGSENKLEKSSAMRFGADLVRIYMGILHARKAWDSNKTSCDWVYERFGAFQSMGYFFSKNKIPWIVETNAPLFLESKSDRKSISLARLARLKELWVYKHADAIVTITNSLKKILIDLAGLPAEKVVVVPNGVDTHRFDPELTTAKRLFDGPTIGFVGSLISWQAIDLLIECVADLRKEKMKWNVVIIGDGPMFPIWKECAIEAGISDQVKFLGKVPWQDIPSLIAGFDICYSGQVELNVGKMYLSPLKLYEYMAMGKPVIASDFEDSNRIVRPGDCGFLFRGGKKDSLKYALTQAWINRNDFQKMGKLSREIITCEHSWEFRVTEMIGKINDVLNSKNGYSIS